MELTLNYTDEINLYTKKITIKGNGYHPLKFDPPVEISPFNNMSNDIVCNSYNGEMIKKCCFNIEELDFGVLSLNESKNKTFILYNFSKTNSFYFDFQQPEFIITDELIIQPNKGTIEPGDYRLIKAVLTSKALLSKYEGDIHVKITWNNMNNDNNNLRNSAIVKQNSLLQSLNQNNINVNASVQLNSNILKIEKESIYLRIIKRCNFEGIIYPSNTKEDDNVCFIEKILQDTAKEIICDSNFEKEFLKNIDEQPLTLFNWTDDSEVSTLSNARKRYIKNINSEAQQTLDVNFIPSPKRSSVNQYRSNAKHSTHQSTSKLIMNEDNIAFDEEEDYKIQDKYMNDLLNKYMYTIPEVNEKLIIVNEDSRKVISNVIMENTIYNIVSEAVYGETNLTKKPRIYFFNDKK